MPSKLEPVFLSSPNTLLITDYQSSEFKLLNNSVDPMMTSLGRRLTAGSHDKGEGDAKVHGRTMHMQQILCDLASAVHRPRRRSSTWPGWPMCPPAPQRRSCFYALTMLTFW